MAALNAQLEHRLARIRRTVGDFDATLADAVAHAAQSADIGAERRAAWLTAASGLIEEAEALLRATARHLQDAGNSSFSIAFLRLFRGDSAGAQNAAQQAIACLTIPSKLKENILNRLERDKGDRFNVLATLDDFGVDPFWHDFECFAFPEKILDHEERSYARFMEYACPRLGQNTPQVKDLLEEDCRLNGESYGYHVNMGHYSWLNGDRGAADYHYVQGKKIALEKRILPIHYNAGIMTWLPEAQAKALLTTRIDDPFGINEWYWAASDFDRRPLKLTIAVGCDTNYFRYFPKLFCSLLGAYLAKGDPFNWAFHISLAEPTEAQAELLANIIIWFRNNLPNVIFSYSIGSLPARDPGLYTCIRFLVLPEILNRYNASAIILDVDNAAPVDFFDRVDILTSYNFALRQHNFENAVQVRGEPWSINASQMYVSNTPIGRDFSAYVRNFINEAYDARLPTTWTIDQNAIGQAYDMVIRPEKTATVRNLANYDTITVMPHLVGGKEALFNLNGQITIENFFAVLDFLYKNKPSN